MSSTNDESSEFMQAAYKMAAGNKETLTASGPTRKAESLKCKGDILTNISDILRKGVSEIAHNSVYVAPNIPPAKLKGAIEGHCFTGSPASVIAICDDTVFGGGEDGFLFTSTHVSYRMVFSDPIKVAYSDIKSIFILSEFSSSLFGSFGKIKILLKNNNYVEFDNLSLNCERLVALLRSCAKYFSENSSQLAHDSADGITQTELPEAGEVSVGAVLAGAVVGVLAVAAAPFTGGGSIFGAATLAGSLAGAGGLAAAAGAAGAAAGAGLAKQQRKQVVESSFNLARERVTAEYAAKTAALQEALAKAAVRFQEHNEYNNFILCLIAVGASMAACDGNVHLDEQSQLREFALGIGSSKLPPTIEKAVSSLIANPPPFDQAMIYVERLGPDVWPQIDAVLTVVSEADGMLTAEEKDFLVKWAEYKIEYKNRGTV